MDTRFREVPDAGCLALARCAEYVLHGMLCASNTAELNSVVEAANPLRFRTFGIYWPKHT